MMRFVAENITRLVEAQAAATQNTSAKQGGGWGTPNKCKHIQMFGGESKVWDEFAAKFRSQVAAGDGK
eukprot:11185304-Lingulodinium_polyedra.AAC.1